MNHSPQEEFETRRERRIEEEYLAGEERSGYADEYVKKKQKIRERAAALLQKVKSGEELCAKEALFYKKNYLMTKKVTRAI